MHAMHVGCRRLYRAEAIILHVHGAQPHACASNEACIIIMTVLLQQLPIRNAQMGNCEHEWEGVGMRLGDGGSRRINLVGINDKKGKLGYSVRLGGRVR